MKIIHLRKWGNGYGILFNKKMLSDLGIDTGRSTAMDVTITKGTLQLKPVAKTVQPNTDLKSWDSQFKKAIAKTGKSEDFWEGYVEDTME